MLRGCLCHESLRATERAALPARACSARCPPPLAAAGSIVWDTKQRQIFNTRRTVHADQAGRAARFQERDPDARILAQPRSDEAAGAATSVDDSVSLERRRAAHLALLRRAAEEESRRQPEGVQNVVHAAARWYSRMSPPSRSWRSIVQVFGCKSWRLVRAGAARLPGRARRRNVPCRRATTRSSWPPTDNQHARAENSVSPANHATSAGCLRFSHSTAVTARSGRIGPRSAEPLPRSPAPYGWTPWRTQRPTDAAS